MSQQETQAAEAFVEAIENQLDQMVAQADDDTLFISGYLRGHLMLSAGYLEMEDKFSIDNVIDKTNESLATAIEAGELNENDQQLVNTMWQNLKQSAQS